MQQGDRIDPWTLERPLGDGGMASVWLVRHGVLHSVHALKLLAPQWVTIERMRERFLAEGRILAQLRHPNLVAVTDVVARPPDLFGLVMDYVEGAPLDLLISEGPMAPERAARILRGVLAGVGYAHARGVVHRDLKPANILVRAGDDPVLLDFGIAKVLEETPVQAGRASPTRVSSRMGTPEYMSPEQVISAARATPASDIWALGCIAYELLTGDLLFSGPTPDDIYARVLAHQHAPLDALPEAWRAIVSRATAPDAADRYASCDAMRAAIDTAQPESTGPVTAPPAAPPPPPRLTQVEAPLPAPPTLDVAVPATRTPTSAPPPTSAAEVARLPDAAREGRRGFALGVALSVGAVALLAGGIGLGAWMSRTPAPEAPAAALPMAPSPEAPAVPAPPPVAPVAVPDAPDAPEKPTSTQAPAPRPAATPPAPATSAPSTPPAPRPQPAPAVTPAPAPTAAPAPPPPSDEAIARAAWDKATPMLRRCVAQHAGTVASTWKVQVDIRADGTVKSATAHGNPDHPGATRCLQDLLVTKADFGTLSAPRRSVFTLAYAPK